MILLSSLSVRHPSWCGYSLSMLQNVLVCIKKGYFFLMACSRQVSSLHPCSALIFLQEFCHFCILDMIVCTNKTVSASYLRQSYRGHTLLTATYIKRSLIIMAAYLRCQCSVLCHCCHICCHTAPLKATVCSHFLFLLLPLELFEKNSMSQFYPRMHLYVPGLDSLWRDGIIIIY